MVLNNVTLMNGRSAENISFKGWGIGTSSTQSISLTVDDFQLDFENALAFPGLINSHDHLDFNCFSPLGTKKYKSYTEWGRHIHAHYKSEINAVLKIPLPLRIAWGMYKNLLAGVTTVINHGSRLEIDHPLITVRQEYQQLHSIKFQKGWRWKLNNPFLRRLPCVIHTGEGSDSKSSEEIDTLLRWNLFKRKLIGVHGVAMNAGQSKRFSGVVWCPESNRVLLDTDANVQEIKEHTRMVFGTDSTLTGNWNFWHHLRLARETKQVSDEELYKMISRSPSHLWHVSSGELKSGRRCDLVIAKRKEAGNVSLEEFFGINPEDILMVIHKGHIRLFDEKYFVALKQLNYHTSSHFPICINGITKFVEGNLPLLMKQIKEYYPQANFPCNAIEAKENIHA